MRLPPQPKIATQILLRAPNWTIVNYLADWADAIWRPWPPIDAEQSIENAAPVQLDTVRKFFNRKTDRRLRWN